MLGAHLDSWHSGTGATDNGAGVAATMEAARIIAALKLKPRRTIRVGLWSGEEQGLYGSKAYVTEHFGYFTNLTQTVAKAESSKEAGSDEATSTSSSTNAASRRQLVRGTEYEKLSIYFNLDNGAGKIRGVYLQGNEALRPMFRRWLEPFRDQGAETLTLANTGSTDHMSFDTIGLPGLEFLQDPLDYSTRTHHFNQDVFDRIQGDDLKQAATIMAAFVYNAAMADERMPRKPLVENPPTRPQPTFDSRL
jgi:Zn-dependent M28 family amino/carboxypeptidase